MIDKWEAWIVSRDNTLLHSSEVMRESPDYLITYNLAPDATDIIRVTFKIVTEVNDIKVARVYRNGALYAVKEFPNSLNNTKLGPDHSTFGFFITKSDLVSSICTCGVKFTGGLCSDWCDLVRNA